MGFLAPLRVELIGHNTWRLTGPLKYKDKDGRIISVPSGFVAEAGLEVAE